MAELHLAVHYLRTGCPNEPVSGLSLDRCERFKVPGGFFATNVVRGGANKRALFLKYFSISERKARAD
jgi:hypothetical protein